ncbi:hypothetical protein ABN214_15130 [Proteus terrae]|uniref:hypothetical protein n=1 Tax=Proteus terrae TaxID=1574161 RepID=UPI0032DAD58C
MWHRGFSVEGGSLYALRAAITATDEYNLDHAIITDDACKEIVDWFKCKLTQIPEWCDYYGITPSPSEASKPAEEVQAIFLTRVAERDAELDRVINKHKSDTIIQRYKAPRIRLLEHDSRLNDIYHPEEASLISAFRFDIKRNLVTLFNNTYSDIRSDDGC